MTERKNVVRLIILFFLAGCPGARNIDFKKEIKTDPERGHYISGVPFFRQEEAMCGPASLASVLNYYGVETTPEEIAEAYFSDEAGGVFPMDLELFARDKGLNTKSYSGDLENLRAEIDMDHPLIIFQNLAFEPVPLRHFAVVVGYYNDGDREWVILYSGETIDLLMPAGKFLETWKRTEYWTLLVLPGGQDGK